MKRICTALAALFLAAGLAVAGAQNQGQQIYQQRCAVCHGNEGQGGIGPALAGNQELQEVEFIVNRILNGAGEMPAFRDQLSDEQIAAVATHERSSWGNNFGEVTAQQVAQQRGGAQQEGGQEQQQAQTQTGQQTQQTQTQRTGAQQQAEGPVEVGLELLAEGFVSPVSLVSPPGDERRFVVDRPGFIYILDENGQRLEQPFLDISDKVVELRENFDERGLLGLAFHPEFADNGRFYVYYSAPLREEAPDDWDHTSHISEFKVSEDDPNLADPNSERILLQVDQPQFNHNAGALAFGPRDGYLYIALGDGGGADDVGLGHPPGGHGQDITSILGNILRIDVDRGWPGYAIPQDNPFVGREGVDEIYAWGWRNPWRMSFDRGGNHSLFVATNGQNLWEAVYIVDQPGNYGWNRLEGTHCFDPDNPDVSPEQCDRVGPRGEPLLLPVIEYPHLGNQGDREIAGISVIGGYVYRGEAIPELWGRYVYGDWSMSFDAPNGQVLMATPTRNAGELWELERLMQLEEYVLGFGEDSAGELYVLTTENTGPTGNTGKVYQIVPGGQGQRQQEQPEGQQEQPPAQPAQPEGEPQAPAQPEGEEDEGP